ncbi:GAF domain-containing protein [Aureimonas frigidaquae]|uniref:histidine kinase n=1 Tax=Aureimonas frigidaquae TaxID=424757 RepID=A0A0P0Z453_9HYPH|nr:GAF domain-containing protein [Aureimonas frigidaquae]BAT28791.1 HWE histidine kinase [Aureimonas frigidaquae]
MSQPMPDDIDRPTSASGGDLPFCDAREAALAALEALDILDTPADENFDRLTRLATYICDAPVALVSLVDRQRQWFKSRVGFEPTETPLSQSVCAHAILQDGVTVIPDLTLDPRTSANTLVTAPPHIRFYAGAPLRDRSGNVLGTLCVIDTVPRPGGLTKRQTDALETLASQVMAQIELRGVVAERGELLRALSTAHERVSADLRQFSAMFDDAPSFMALLRGPDHVFEMVNRAYLGIIGRTDVVGKSVAQALPDAAEQGYLQLLDTVYRTGEAYTTSAARYDVQPKPGAPTIERYLDFIFQPIRDASGSVTGIFVEGFDVSARVLQMKRSDALLKLGDRIRLLTDVSAIAQVAAEVTAETLGAARAGIGTVDAVAETVELASNWCAPGTAELTGLYRFRDYGTFINDLKAGQAVIIQDVSADPRTRDKASQFDELGIAALVNLPVIEHGQIVLLAFVHYKTRRELTEEDIAFIRQVADRAQSAIARARAEEHQRILNLELSHRLKNTLATVQAIASQTLSGVSERPLVDTFLRRLHALASAHTVLLQQQWADAPLDEIVAGALGTLGIAHRVKASGPSLRLGATAALSSSLLLHELGTNALKYGALSNDTGQVELAWTIEDENGADSVVLRWRERGGPTVSAPTRRGFGSRLVGRGLLGMGGAQQLYAADGLVVRLSAPLAQLQSS